MDIGPWLGSSGVVKDLGMGTREDAAGVYRPSHSGARPRLRVAVGVRGKPESFACAPATLERGSSPHCRFTAHAAGDVIADGMRETVYMRAS